MSLCAALWLELVEYVPEILRGPSGIAILCGLIAVLMLMMTVRMVGGRKKPKGGRESSVENLAEYPAPPPAGETTLLLEGAKVRVRLVVVAPVGKNPIDLDEVSALLDQVLDGLGDVVEADKPKIKVWAPQLSSQGFAPKFHRLTERPEADGQPSRWILLAGPASAGKRPVLVGLALMAAKANTKGRMTLEAANWPALLSITSR